MSRADGLFRALCLALLPTSIARHIVNRLGYAIAPGARVGFSWVQIDRLEMAPHSRIGHFNRLSGPGRAVFASYGALGHSNLVLVPRDTREGWVPVLTLGVWAKITHGHHVDLTDSVTLGDYSTVAGAGSQLWTHGYVHELEGIGRYRIDGAIVIENNVSIGSASVITQGVRIGRGIVVGAGTVVSKSLTEPGFYVSSTMRQFPRPADPDTRDDLILTHPGGGDADRSYRRREP